jgi:CRP-like cAMP-binding protein
MSGSEKQFDIAAIITAAPWFREATDSALQTLIDAAKVRHIKTDEHIFCLGDKLTEVYMVLAGRVRLNITSSLGQEFALVDMEDNYWFGEAAIADGESKALEAQAQGPATILAIPMKAFNKACEISPVIYKNLFKETVQRSRGLYTLLAGLAFYPLRARLAGRLLSLIEDHGIETDKGVLIDIKLSQNDFARLSLGSRQRINKIFREWNEREIVVQESDHYCIKNVDALTAETELHDIE